MQQPRAMPRPDPAALLGDGRALADILTLAGPETAQRILRQMHADLSETAATLRPALAAANWNTIRAQSHVLISLAGTIGAMRLHALAIDLNTAAHAQDPGQTAALAAPLLSDLDALTALLADRLPAGGTA
jgi:HPt (histidine-containing phosphotransfer) domain-containing protein